MFDSAGLLRGVTTAPRARCTVGNIVLHRGTLFDRRDFLRAAAGAALAAAGCKSTPEPPGPDCDPPSVSGVDWIPDVAHPVAWGEEHLTTADGAPRIVSIYYPSPRFIPPRPMLLVSRQVAGCLAVARATASWCNDVTSRRLQSTLLAYCRRIGPIGLRGGSSPPHSAFESGNCANFDRRRPAGHRLGPQRLA